MDPNALQISSIHIKSANNCNNVDFPDLDYHRC